MRQLQALSTHPPEIARYSRQEKRDEVRRISLRRIKLPRTSDAPPWLWTGHAWEIVGTIP